MEIITIILFVVIVAGPLVGYGLYTARFGEPRRADKPRKGSKAAATGSSAAR